MVPNARTRKGKNGVRSSSLVLPLQRVEKEFFFKGTSLWKGRCRALGKIELLPSPYRDYMGKPRDMSESLNLSINNLMC